MVPWELRAMLSQQKPTEFPRETLGCFVDQTFETVDGTVQWEPLLESKTKESEVELLVLMLLFRWIEHQRR
ncbi:hypothetical protein VP1G_10716 [Cytospora mali]|uniref:Uncharacterized protein n=1 Tax=Cytospora mali TaxID=578113 RepID=A0A194UTE8_CYTMA|nr:hypothetical protein VP1G_10716 [Valsa mali var. pyri (nom. inval.)]